MAHGPYNKLTIRQFRLEEDMPYTEKIRIKVISDFIKAFSCSYAVTKNLSRIMGLDPDPLLLSAAVGFSSGVGTMGDTCGVVNSGVMVLGACYGSLSARPFYRLCGEYYRRLEQAVGPPNCGKIHGGRHLAKNFRRAMLTGKPLKCAEVLSHGAVILKNLSQKVDENDLSFIDERNGRLDAIIKHFDREEFHCCLTPLKRLAEASGKSLASVLPAGRGFVGGIGFNGTLCGTISAAVIFLGLREGLDLGKFAGYGNSGRIAFHGLIKSEKIFSDEKRFPAARLFQKCQQIYETVENRFGSAQCGEILGLDMETSQGLEQYIADQKLSLCRTVAKTVIDSIDSPFLG